MGSITVTKAKGIWKTLPAPLRGAATLLAVLALAALLTTVRHNASAYLTGVWDTGSQTLVYGRIHQMEQGQYAPGGFLGVYTDNWSDDTNRALFRDDTPTDAAAFHPYTHEGPVLVPLDLAAAAAGGALALPLHPRARQNAPRVLAAGGRRLHGALHVRV